MQHKQPGFAHLDHAVDAPQQQFAQLAAFVGRSDLRADQHRFAFQHGFHFAQLVRGQGGATGHQIADRVRGAEPRRNFDRAGENHDIGGDSAASQPLAKLRRIRRRDVPSDQRLYIGILGILRQRDGEPAAAESERAQLRRQRGFASPSRSKRLLARDVAASDAKIAYALRDQPGNIVVAHQQQIDRQIFAKAEQLVATLAKFQPATRK